MSKELKPCPYCNGGVFFPTLEDEGHYGTYCPTCETFGPLFPSPEEATKHWNTRPREDALQAEVERLREALATAREGLSIAAGWARSKPDSGRARDKIKAGLDAIRFALNPRAALKGAPHE